MPLLICFDDFELDEAQFELRREGHPVAVQPKVLELLFHLARNRDRVVSKDELFSTVWEGAVVTEASLSHAVSLARKALGETPREGRYLRTVRRKGLQFVAEVRAPKTPAPKTPAPKVRSIARRDLSTLMETAQEAATAESHGDQVRLYVVLHGELPHLGGASWSLGGVDEVRLGRGSDRRTERDSEVAALLTLRMPDTLLSRDHARLIKTENSWALVDQESRNGTFVNGERTDKHTLVSGDIFRCGHTFFRWALEPGGETPSDVEANPAADNLLSTVTPALLTRARYLARVAPSSLPILFIGPSGAGKTHLAERVHAASGRRGPLSRIEAGTLAHDPQRARDALDAAAEQGSVVIENVERIDETIAPILASMLDEVPDVRMLATSIASYESLQEHIDHALLMRLAGYRCELPSLRERPGDFGVLVASLATASGHQLALDAPAGTALVRHAWPGNMRELDHTLNSAAQLSGGNEIGLKHLPAELSNS